MYSFRSVLSHLVLFGLAGLVLTPGVKADDWNLRTKVTFSQSVEIPHMVLGPGTYVMKVAEPRDGNIVQFFNENETHLYATVMAVPAYRLNITDKTQILFEERAANQPQAIKEWFYPGNYWGEQFVYSKHRDGAMGRTTASAPPQPAIRYLPASQSAENPTDKRLETRIAEAPAGPSTAAITTTRQQTEPTEMAQATPAPSVDRAEDRPASLPETAAPVPQPVAPPAELPKTATELPLIAILGMVSLAAGWLIRRWILTMES